MKSSLTNIINYIYSAKNVNKEISDIDTFFIDSKSFPEFISLMYKQNLFNFTNSESVFDQTLDFLIKQDQFFEKFRNMSPVKENELLMSLFTRLFFKMNEEEILEKSGEIFESCGVEYKDNDIFCGKFLYLLLNILTEGRIRVKQKSKNEEDDDDEPDYDAMIEKILEKAKVPIVILRPISQNHQLFLIQIQIIFQIYSKIISDISKKFDLFSSINLRRGANNKDPTFLLNKSKSLTTNCYMKIINYILISKFSEKQFENLSELHKNGIKEFIDIVNEITGINVIFQENLSSNELLTEIANKLGIQKKFDFDDENNFDEFIKLIFIKNNYFKNDDKFLTYCNKILVDYGFKIKSIEDIFKSKGFEYFILIHRLILIQFKVLKYDLIPPRYKVSFDLLKKAFERFNISFILDEETFQSFCEFPLKFQLKIILDKFDQTYLKKLMKYKRVFEFEKKEDKKERYLILTLNAVGLKNGLFIYNIKSFLEGNLFQFFVEGLIEKSLSDYIDIKQLGTNEKSESNIIKIINFLKTQKKLFNTLGIDFKNEQFTIKSIESVILTLLDLYFIKQPINVLIERCNSIIGMKIEVNDIRDFSNVGIFFYLMNFIIHKNLKCEIKDLNQAFKNANVEKIIDQRCILQPYAYRKYIYYQLQIYFNKFDDSSLKVIERFYAASTMMNHLKSSITIFLSDIKKFTSNIKIKKVVRENENERIDRDTLSRSSKYKYSNVNATKTFNESILELKKIEQKKKNFKDNKDLYKFLIECETKQDESAYNFKLIDGTIVACNKLYFEFQKHQEIISNMGSFSNIKYKRSNKNKKLYKIFYYNESLSKWIFDSSEFFKLITDYELDINNRNTCFISFMNTNIDEIYTFNPNIDSKNLNNENFIVYGYHYDDEDNNKSKEINPIYLFLNFPKKNVAKKEEKEILSIVMQVYVFLYAFSDIQIVLIKNIYSKDLFKSQVPMANLINDFQNEVNFGYLKTTLFITNNKDSDESKTYFKIMKDQPKKKFIAIKFQAEKPDFYNYLNELIIQYQPISFYDLFLRFDNFSKFELHSLYIQLRFQFNKTEEFLKAMIKKRVKELKDEEFDIQYEFSWFPDFDISFASQYQFLFYNELKEQKKSNLIKDIIIEQMESRTKKYIVNLTKFVKTKLYMESKEITMFLNGFENFLDEIYENIIMSLNLSLISEIIYKDCLDVLKKIKENYLKKLYSIFKEFEEKNLKRNKEEERNLVDDFKKSTRYIMKEVEHIKEIKCEVEIEGKGLKNEIEQDF